MGHDCHSKNEKCCCSCHEKHHGEHHEDDKQKEFVHWLYEVADEAWTEVLKEKIKEHILSNQSERMTELAKIVSDGNSQRWKHKMEKKHACGDFKEKLRNFFSHKK